MVGDIKAIRPCVKSASEKLFLDLHTVLAPSGEERTLDAAAQVERAALWPYASAARDAHSRVGVYTVAGGCAADVNGAVHPRSAILSSLPRSRYTNGLSNNACFSL